MWKALGDRGAEGETKSKPREEEEGFSQICSFG